MSDDEFNVEDELPRMIKRVVNGFEVWLNNRIETGVNGKYWTGYELKLKDDKYQVVFAFQKNGEDGWWKHLGEDDESRN